MALRGEKRVGHRAADEDLVHLSDDVVDRLDLPGDLGPSEYRGQRAGGGDEGFFEIGDLVLHEKPSRLLPDEPCDGDVRRVAPVGGREGVVHVHVAKCRELFSESLVVFLLAGMESHVFQEEDVARLHRGHGLFRRLPDAVGNERNFLPEEGGEAFCRGGEAHLRDRFSLGPPQVGQKDRLRSPLPGEPDRGQDGLDPGVVGDVPGLVQRDVEIDADEDPLPGQIKLVDTPYLHRVPSQAVFVNGTRKTRRRQAPGAPAHAASAQSSLMAGTPGDREAG